MSREDVREAAIQWGSQIARNAEANGCAGVYFMGVQIDSSWPAEALLGVIVAQGTAMGVCRKRKTAPDA